MTAEFEGEMGPEDRTRLRALFKEVGGTFHGPHVEHASIEEEAFWRFVGRVYYEGAYRAKRWVKFDDDLPLPEDKAIEAAHPMNAKGNGRLFDEAMRLVGARRSKYGLVELVTWLLARERDAVQGLKGARDRRQAEVAAWCAVAFGADHASSVPQRGVRLLEEAVEAYQAAGGEPGMAHKLIDYVFSRPPGALSQELGGIGITLLALAAAADLSADACEAAELQRVLAKPLSHFRARNEAKNAAGFNVAAVVPPS